MARVIVESVFPQPMADEDFAALSVCLEPCLTARHCVWHRSYVSADRTRMTCDYEAPDAESVREACRSAGVGFERIWAAQVFTAEEHPAMKAQLAELHAKTAR